MEQKGKYEDPLILVKGNKYLLHLKVIGNAPNKKIKLKMEG
jgi:hypothetical protein